ncbi:hypothetical protein BGW41_001399 [Actinomortierella wolfii]|nr:hypothetical protein BGW41_001399 [Actinomortierella wolfii]
MKTILILTCVAAAAMAAPVHETNLTPGGDIKVLADKKTVDIGKLDLGGLQIPSSLTAAMNTKTAPENYGNMNLGSGMMPSQIVHYGTELGQEHSGYVQPTFVHATGGHSVDLQHQQPEHALINANLDRLSLDRSLIQKAYSPETLRAFLGESHSFVYPHTPKLFRLSPRDDDEDEDEDYDPYHDKYYWGGGRGGGWDWGWGRGHGRGRGGWGRGN